MCKKDMMNIKQTLLLKKEDMILNTLVATKTDTKEIFQNSIMAHLKELRELIALLKQKSLVINTLDTNMVVNAGCSTSLVSTVKDPTKNVT